MSSFEQIVRDIKSLKIQGATNVAFSSLDALEIAAKSAPKGSAASFSSYLFHAHKRLLETRPTEPFMHNSLAYALRPLREANKESAPLLTHYVLHAIDKARAHFIDAHAKMITQVLPKIKESMTIYTHCHSSSVTGTLVHAKRLGRSFRVCNTETRPLYQGRKTARELSAAHIPVDHYVDSGMEYAIRDADLVLLGVDAITADGSVANKIGTALACTIAKDHHVPVYFCTDSWKFDPLTLHGKKEKIEMRSASEVWPHAPKGVAVKDFAFDLVPAGDATGVISELGCLAPRAFVRRVITQNPWMTEKRKSR